MPCLDWPHDLRWNPKDPIDISVLRLWSASFSDSQNHAVLCRQDDRGYLMRAERLTQTPPRRMNPLIQESLLDSDKQVISEDT